MNQRGRFITLEGGEGVGKSTNLCFVQDWLNERGIDYLHTREPGGTPLAEEIRTLLLSPREEPLAADTELLLVFAARAQHLHQVILPALAKGRWVLCDRFVDATYAYQGYGRGLPLSLVAQLEALVVGSHRPDLTLLLDADPAVGRARVEQRGALDRIEAEAAPFFQRVREGYLARAQAEPERFAVIDASAPLLNVQEAIAQALESRL